MRNLLQSILFFILILCTFPDTIYPAPDLVVNQNKPARGEWNFDLEELWGIKKFGDYFFVKVRNIRIDHDGNVYVLDNKFVKVFVFDSKGNFLYPVGRFGGGPGEFKGPINIFVMGRYLIIEDMNNEINFFTKIGEFKKSFKPGLNIHPRRFVSEFRYITLRLVDPFKKKEKQNLEIHNLNTREKTVIAEIPSETAALATSNNIRVRIRVPGTTSKVVTAISNNKVYFANNGTYLIKKIDLHGKEELSFSIEGRKRKPVPAAYKKEQANSFLPSGQGRLPDNIVKQLIKDIPDHCTYFEQIIVDESGGVHCFI